MTRPLPETLLLLALGVLAIVALLVALFWPHHEERLTDGEVDANGYRDPYADRLADAVEDRRRVA